MPWSGTGICNPRVIGWRNKTGVCIVPANQPASAWSTRDLDLIWTRFRQGASREVGRVDGRRRPPAGVACGHEHLVRHPCPPGEPRPRVLSVPGKPPSPYRFPEFPCHTHNLTSTSDLHLNLNRASKSVSIPIVWSKLRPILNSKPMPKPKSMFTFRCRFSRHGRSNDASECEVLIIVPGMSAVTLFVYVMVHISTNILSLLCLSLLPLYKIVCIFPHGHLPKFEPHLTLSNLTMESSLSAVKKYCHIHIISCWVSQFHGELTCPCWDCVYLLWIFELRQIHNKSSCLFLLTALKRT